MLSLAERLYAPSLGWALRRPGVVLGVACASLTLAGWLLAHRGSEFLPEINEGALYLTFTLPQNASLDEGRRVVPHLTQALQAFPQVEAVSSQLGSRRTAPTPRCRATWSSSSSCTRWSAGRRTPRARARSSRR